MQTLHTGGSGYRRRSHLVHEQADEKDLQREIDDLKKRLRRAQRKQTPSSSDVSSDDDEDASYRNAQKLHLVSLIPVRRNILTRGGEGVHLGGG